MMGDGSKPSVTMELVEGRMARVHSIQSKPELNGACVRLGKRINPETENERWETTDEFTWLEASVKRANLNVLPPMSALAQELYKLLTTSFLKSSGTSNDLIYHLISHHNEIPLLHLALLLHKKLVRDMPLAVEARLEAMRAAARELVDAHSGFGLTRTETCIRRPPLPAKADEEQVEVQASGALTALRLNAAAEELPVAVVLPPRVDYLNALADALEAPAVAPMLVVKKSGGQRLVQPVLYVAVGGVDVLARPLNALASALAGVEIHGDAFLSSVEFRDSEGLEGQLMARELCGLPRVAALLHERSADVVTFVAARLGRPMLGAPTIPRVEAWLKGGTAPKGLLLEYTQQFPERAQVATNLSSWAVGHDGVSAPAEHQQPRGFRAGCSLAWPAGAPPPDSAPHNDGMVTLRTSIYSRKAATKAADKVQSAEPQAAVMLLKALHLRNQHHDALAGEVGGAGQAPYAPVFRITNLEVADVGGAEAVASSHPEGTMLHVSYSLELLRAGTEALPPAGGAGIELVLLEKRTNDQVLLGGGALVERVEDILAEMAVEEVRRVFVRANLLHQPVTCQLTLQLHRVEPPDEETPIQAFFNKPPGAAGAMPHWRERLNFVAGLVTSWTPVSLGDVGCGEGKLIEKLIRDGAPPNRMVGADSTARALRTAGRKISTAVATEDAPIPAPSVELLGVDLASLVLNCEVITFVEVIEHLEPHVLEQVGPVLLGACAPHRLLVTTPNKEYNLNFRMEPDDWDGTTRVPDPGSYQLRNLDHQFEWTRAEFRAWAEGVAQQYGYVVTFDGVGGGPFDEVVPYGEWRGGGPQTQAAVFERAGEWVAGDPGAPLHEHGQAVLWSLEEVVGVQ